MTDNNDIGTYFYIKLIFAIIFNEDYIQTMRTHNMDSYILSPKFLLTLSNFVDETVVNNYLESVQRENLINIIAYLKDNYKDTEIGNCLDIYNDMIRKINSSNDHNSKLFYVQQIVYRLQKNTIYLDEKAYEFVKKALSFDFDVLCLLIIGDISDDAQNLISKLVLNKYFFTSLNIIYIEQPQMFKGNFLKMVKMIIEKNRQQNIFFAKLPIREKLFIIKYNKIYSK